MSEELSQEARDLQRTVRKFSAAAPVPQAKTNGRAIVNGASQIPKNLMSQAVCGGELWWP